MLKKKQILTDTETLKDLIIKGIQEKKGIDVITLDLRQIQNAVCDYFVICHGSSTTQVTALSDSVEVEVKKASGMYPSHKEGHANAEWIILDYFDIVVHIFQESARNFFQLEGLWADAIIQKIEDVKPNKK
jgi:ribosome-associated protein